MLSTTGKMWKFSCIVLVTVAAILADVTSAAAPTTTASPGDAVLKKARDDITHLEQVVDSMAHQLMQQQTFVEERIRSEGMSGVKAVHHSHEGTEPEYGDTHVGSSPLNMGDRINTDRRLGIGDFVAVMNGVEFHALRNGAYGLRKASSNKANLDEVVDIDYPDVPSAVTRKATLQEQIEEMRLWFKAFKDQDYSVRDYRKFFKPNLCYLEGAWYLNHRTVDEPDTSEKHFDDADKWYLDMDMTRFQAYDGARSQRENYDYMPTILYNMSDNRIPQFAHWRSRLLCHPLSQDVPTNFLKPQDDLATRIRFKRTWEKHPENMQARFKINEFGTERGTKHTLLDKLMGEIPGKDNYGANIKDDAFGLVSYDISKTGNVVLNSAKYHRWYKLAQAGAMGLQVNHRGYHDENLWVALTTQKDIMPLTINRWVTNKKVWETRRVSYAIPLEIVYTTPLSKWNPYDIEYHGSNNTHVKLNNRNGHQDKAHAYNGNSRDVYYRTPIEFYTNGTRMKNSVKGVLDKNGEVKAVVGAGQKVLSYPIDDVGKVRLRYPIFPVHSEGTTVGMELEALKDAVLKMSTYAYLYENQPMGGPSTSTSADVDFHVRDSYRNPPGLHGHDFTLTAAEYQSLVNGTEIKVTTSYNLGHNHELSIYYNKNSKHYYMRTCDGQTRCWDAHSNMLDIMPQ